jgi:DNA-binding NtrC family response regulator
MRLVESIASNTQFVAPVIVGKSAALAELLTAAAKIAASDAKTLITGESGVGKDVFARFIHANSSRAGQRYVALNCASFSETLLESELFGHVKGSFTGAYRDKVGKLQQAHRGTIFLDEIAEMTLRMQAMLLRFLENGEVHPVGSDAPATRVDVRVVSATNRDLAGMIDRGEFREDLLYRIKVTHLHVPSLRQRREDITALVDHTITKTGKRVSLTQEAMNLLQAYAWPGNVRELQNVVEQLVALAAGDTIGVDDLPPSIVVSGQSGHVYPKRERRRRVSDDLYDGLVSGGMDFWKDVHAPFTSRDLTRNDIRQLVRRALATTGGNYRAVLQLFGMEQQDYKRLMNFLAAHECAIDYREFRQPKPESHRDAERLPRRGER